MNINLLSALQFFEFSERYGVIFISFTFLPLFFIAKKSSQKTLHLAYF